MKAKQILLLLVLFINILLAQTTDQNVWKLHPRMQEISSTQNIYSSHMNSSTGKSPDYFPLKVGNEYSYDFKRTYSGFEYGGPADPDGYSYYSSGKDSGLVTYSIIGKTVINDTIIVWRVKEHSNLLIKGNINNSYDTNYVSIKDYHYDLTEEEKGMHKVSFYGLVWRFDSLYRFDSSDARGISFNYDNIAGWEIPVIYTFAEDTGLVEASIDFDVATNTTNVHEHLIATLSSIITGNSHQSGEAPGNFLIYQNYPNPFNPTTTITYVLSSRSRVLLTVYNILGQRIKDLIREDQTRGEHQVIFNASSLSSGTYFYKLTAIDSHGNKQTQSKSMVLIK